MKTDLWLAEYTTSVCNANDFRQKYTEKVAVCCSLPSTCQ